MNTLALTLRQVRFENRSFWRNPAAAFFTFVFPLMFMVIFNVLLGGTRPINGSSGLRIADFYTPGIIVFAVVTATYTNIAMMITNARDLGILKRMRGTPLPTVAYLGGRILHAIGIALVLVIIVALFGAVFYGVRFPWDQLPVLVLALVVGAASFCALGLAIAGIIPNADSAPAIVQFTVLPLNFVSNVFIDMRNAPDWLNFVSRLFPVRHFADALFAIYHPLPTTPQLNPLDLVAVAAWGLAGLLVALRFFTWEPRR